MRVDAASMSFLREVLLVLSGLTMAATAQSALARTIDISRGPRHCLTTSIVPSNRLKDASTCIAHNSCNRTVFATFDAYPFRARKKDAAVHAKVSHWVSPGDSEVFGWNSTSAAPTPECRVLEMHH